MRERVGSEILVHWDDMRSGFHSRRPQQKGDWTAAPHEKRKGRKQNPSNEGREEKAAEGAASLILWAVVAFSLSSSCWCFPLFHFLVVVLSSLSLVGGALFSPTSWWRWCSLLLTPPPLLRVWCTSVMSACWGHEHEEEGSSATKRRRGKAAPPKGEKQRHSKRREETEAPRPHNPKKGTHSPSPPSRRHRRKGDNSTPPKKGGREKSTATQGAGEGSARKKGVSPCRWAGGASSSSLYGVVLLSSLGFPPCVVLLSSTFGWCSFSPLPLWVALYSPPPTYSLHYVFVHGEFVLWMHLSIFFIWKQNTMGCKQNTTGWHAKHHGRQAKNRGVQAKNHGGASKKPRGASKKPRGSKQKTTDGKQKNTGGKQHPGVNRIPWGQQNTLGSTEYPEVNRIP